MAIYMWREYIPPELCFTANTAGSTVSLTKSWSPTSVTLETSTDWSSWSTYTIWSTITLANIGDKVWWRNASETTTWFSTDTNNNYQFVMTWSIAWSWDITSLLNKHLTLTLTNSGNSCFNSLFKDCSQLISSPEIPATTLSDYCYNYMFWNCTWLIVPPSLPATTLWAYCYYQMFAGCTWLTSIPNLPALILKEYCYNLMFNYCSNIKMSSTQTWIYQTAYRIPTTWTWTNASYALYDVFKNTWWTLTWWWLTINTTYYTSNEVV